ncbi:MAG: hypothetical protein ACOZDY_18490 [Pseudomonadota bacterium]
MSIRIRTDDLSPAEVSFLNWQYGFDEGSDPFERALWQAITRAWASDHGGESGAEKTRHLERLGSPGAYPEEVALFRQFKSERSDQFWMELIRRAGLADRRQRSVTPMVERRRRAGTRA